jgi:rare lipoprotein A
MISGRYSDASLRWGIRLCAMLACAAVIATIAGCGGSRPRPSGSSASRGGSAPRSGSAGPNDDISRSQSQRYGVDSDSVPTEIPDVSKLIEPVPKIEPRSLYGNKSPYTVLGRSYSVLPTPGGYVERGIASFYGNKFHGYKTSSLESYDMYQFSAAHKTLPLPSYARVTNLENGKSVIVRVNDRGPFHENRIIDLSFAAAVKIGVWPKGTGLVEVRSIDPGQPDQDLPAPPLVPATGGHPGIFLQVGAFSDEANANRVAQQLKQANFAPVSLMEADINGRHVRRVRVGPLADVDTADRVTSQIEDMGLPRPQVAVD